MATYYTKYKVKTNDAQNTYDLYYFWTHASLVVTDDDHKFVTAAKNNGSYVEGYILTSTNNGGSVWVNPIDVTVGTALAATNAEYTQKIGTEQNYFTYSSLVTEFAKYLPLAGGTMTGNINFSGNTAAVFDNSASIYYDTDNAYLVIDAGQDDIHITTEGVIVTGDLYPEGAVTDIGTLTHPYNNIYGTNIYGTWSGNTIPVGKGGTGLITIGANQILVGKSGNTFEARNLATAGTDITSGATTIPTSGAVADYVTSQIADIDLKYSVAWNKTQYDSETAPTTADLAKIPAGVYVKYNGGASVSSQPGTLTTASADKHTVYLVYDSNGTVDTFDEYMAVKTGDTTYAWEKIGETATDLDGYLYKSDYYYSGRILTANGTNGKVDAGYTIASTVASTPGDTALPTSGAVISYVGDQIANMVTAAATLTENQVILGAGQKGVKASSYYIGTSWASTSGATTLLTQTAIENHFTGWVHAADNLSSGKIVVGGGQKEVATTSYGILDSTGTWADTDDANVPTVKAISAAMGNKYVQQGGNVGAAIAGKYAVAGDNNSDDKMYCSHFEYVDDFTDTTTTYATTVPTTYAIFHRATKVKFTHHANYDGEAPSGMITGDVWLDAVAEPTA